MAITFGDGFANQYQCALPVLEADGLTATSFPCSGLIGVKNGEAEYLSATEPSSLSQMGSRSRTTPTTTARSSGASLWPLSRS